MQHNVLKIAPQEFERHGLRKVAVEVGDKFDTKYHQAMLQVRDYTKPWVRLENLLYI